MGTPDYGRAGHSALRLIAWRLDGHLFQTRPPCVRSCVAQGWGQGV